MKEYTILEKARTLSKETQVGLLFCYKALKRCKENYQQAYDYLLSDEFRNSVHILRRGEPVTLLKIEFEDSLVIDGEISTNTELKEYILEKLARGGISEKEMGFKIHFGEEMCNHVQTYVYCKNGKYCYRYLGMRESECFSCTYDTKEELLKQVIEDIAGGIVCTVKTAKRSEEYALELALRIDDKVVELMKIK